jgi:hypothetical protein
MSYSFSVKAANKTEAKKMVADQMQGVVNNQPVHKADADAAIAAAGAFIDILGEPNEGDEINVSVNGYLSWHGDMSNADFIGANVNVSASVKNVPVTPTQDDPNSELTTSK